MYRNEFGGWAERSEPTIRSEYDDRGGHGAKSTFAHPRADSMHRGEEARGAETGQPGPYRLFADAEVPRSDHGVGAADQIVDPQQPDPAFADGNAAAGGILAA